MKNMTIMTMMTIMAKMARMMMMLLTRMANGQRDTDRQLTKHDTSLRALWCDHNNGGEVALNSSLTHGIKNHP